MRIRVAVAVLSLASVVAPTAADAAGRLARVTPTRDLGCRVRAAHGTRARFLGTRLGPRCGTVVAVRGGGLYGSAGLGSPHHRLGGRALRALRPLARSAVGAGTPRDPRRVTTTAAAGGLVLREVDTTDAGSATVRTRLEVTNPGRRSVSLGPYRLGRCFTGADPGYGRAAGRSAGCVDAVQDGTVARPVPGRALLAWRAGAEPASASARSYAALAALAARGRPLLGACHCPSPVRVGAGVFWRVHLAPGTTASVHERLTLSAGPARRATSLHGAATARRLGAVLRVHGRPLAGRHVRFSVAERTVCTARTDRSGRASCPWRGRGPRPRFRARFDGTLAERPVERAVPGPPAPLGAPPTPACGKLGPATSLDGRIGSHFATGVIAIRAPSCRSARYAVLTTRGRRTVVLGSVPGDGSRRLSVFLTLPFGDEASCRGFRVTAARTGRVLDRVPVVCLPGSQKAR